MKTVCTQNGTKANEGWTTLQHITAVSAGTLSGRKGTVIQPNTGIFKRLQKVFTSERMDCPVAHSGEYGVDYRLNYTPVEKEITGVDAEIKREVFNTRMERNKFVKAIKREKGISHIDLYRV